MSFQKFVGRYAPVALIDDRSPHRNGVQKETRARMTRRFNPRMLTTERAISSLRSLRGALARITVAGCVMTLAMASAAHARTYVINNCPSAPRGNGDPGPYCCGHWEPLRDPRTDSSGRFRVVYEFEGGVGRFPFRAEVLGGQSGLPFTHGDSRPVDVTAN